MLRLLVLLAVLAVVAPAPVALGQDPQGGGGAFGPLPQAPPAPTPAPTASPSVAAQEDTDRTLLFVIGGGLLVLFVFIARFITRDARRTLGEDRAAAGPSLREEGPHRHAKQTKSKARAKTKAQRQARRQNR